MWNRASRPNSQLSEFFPKVIKIEPVVGRQTAVVFQAVGIQLCPLLNLLVSMPPVNLERFSKQFKMDIVAVAAAIKPKEENDRHL